jgi:hypothetical protein
MKEGVFVTVKEYLCTVKDKEDEILKQKEYIETLRSVLDSISVKMDSERVQSSTDVDKFGKVFAQIDEEERKLEQMKEDFIQFKVDVLGRINNVSVSKYRTLLIEKYINYKTFKAISVMMGYSYDYVLELHGNALEEFGKIPC